MATHSDKALTTIACMGTTPADWQLTPIKWVMEEREIIGLVRCPTCNGDKWVRKDGDKAIPRPTGALELSEYLRLARNEAVRAGYGYGNCPKCLYHSRKGWGWMARGEVAGLVKATVPVGYPQFPEGVSFDSRFCGSNCNLCNKSIMKSGRVPVHATGADGKVHGMFVGEDCALKFLAVKIKRDKGSIMEDGS